MINDEQQRIVAYLNGLPPGGVLRDRQAKVKALRELQSPPLHFGDASQSHRDAAQSASGEEL